MVLNMKPSGIGGQAVMEGIMMKNGSEYAVAVRKADQTIEVKKETYHSISEKLPFLKVPFLRGIVNFAESLYLGMKTLMYSASFYEEEEVKRKEDWEEWISTGTGRNFTGDIKKKKRHPKVDVFLEKAGSFFMVLCSFVIAIALFMLLPMILSEQLMGMEASLSKAVLEGVLRLLIFFLYLFLISKLEDIEHVFMYHGAEHKTINCIENGYSLTVENVRKQSRQHKRCGTSFLFMVIILSIIFFIFIRTEVLWLKVGLRILLVPVIAAISYEFIRLAGRSEHPLVSALSKPGLAFQYLTTREPDDDMIEVAIRSVEAVFDWRSFLGDEAVSGSDETVQENQKAEDTLVSGAKATGWASVRKADKSETIWKIPKVASQRLSEEQESADAEGTGGNTAKRRFSAEKSSTGWAKVELGSAETTNPAVKVQDVKDDSAEEEAAATRTLSEMTRERLRKTIFSDEYSRRNMAAEEEEAADPVVLAAASGSELLPDEDDEDDPILKALDKFFGE